MKVIIAKHAGFCEGVERAYRIALEQTKTKSPVYILGHLVHNKQVIDKFEKLGIHAVTNLDQISNTHNGTIIISAHGVGPNVYESAKHLGLKIIDTTCPWVKKPQRIAHDLAKENRKIIIVGDKGHTEVKGIVAWSNNQAVVIENLDQLKALNLKPEDTVGVLAQTTQAEDHFNQIVSEINKTVKDIKVYNTICGATAKHQNGAIQVTKKVDTMIVIGDQKSANTKRLFQLCSKINSKTYWVQSFSELKSVWFNKANLVGVTAGASTPDWIINEVVDQIEKY